MPSDEKAIAGCAGKMRFRNFERASQVARRTRRSRGIRLQVYRCRQCQGFHVGTNSTRDYGDA